MTKIDMSARDKRSIWLLALGLLLLAAGMATVSSLLAFAGLFAIAITVRYRKKASLWEYLAFLALAILIVAAPFALVAFAAWLGRRLYRRREEDRLLAT